MKTKLLAWLVFLIVISFGGCGEVKTSNNSNANAAANSTTIQDTIDEPHNNAMYPEQDIIYMSLDDTIKACDIAAKATLSDFYSENGNNHYTFSIIDTYKGDIENINITVDEEIAINHCEELGIEYLTGNNEYTVGGEYIIFLNHFDSVYYDYFLFTNDIFMPVEENTIQDLKIDSLHEETNIQSVSDVKNLIQTLSDEESLISTKSYTDSINIQEIIDFSDYIVKVSIDSLYIEGVTNRNTYICNVIDAYKGTPENTINAILFKDTVDVGSEYYLLLTKTDGGQFYILSSKNSIYAVDDETFTKYLNNLQ